METKTYLSQCRGAHTSLVSFYLRDGSPLGAARAKIRAELKTAANIKSRV